MTDYPSDQAVWAWTSKVSPAGARDATLWGFAYAAYAPAQFAETGTQGLADFQAFQALLSRWLAPVAYWDNDFLLAYIQAQGHFPSGPDDFTGWLAANGYATKNANGSYAKSGKYPTGGLGYPPGGATTGSAASLPVTAAGAADAPPGAATAAAVQASGILATIQKHPVETAIGAAIGALLLFGRR